MKKKRILSWLIALAMAVSMLPTVAFAANAYEITAPGVVGTFNDWQYDDLMTESQPGIWEVTRNSISGNFEFKIRNEKAWDFSFGGTFTDFGEAFDVSVSSSSNIAVTVEGTKDLKFVLDLTGYNSETGTGAKVSVVDVTAKPEYTITFDANGGAVSTATAQTVSGKLASLPNATLENHIFDGWYTEKTGGDGVTTDTVFDKDTTVYAQYSKAYDIYVAGIQVTEKNAADVLENADEGASVVYDALSNTLTLTDANISSESGNGIEAGGDIAIAGVDTDANGSNTITGGVNAIKASGNIVISGKLGNITGGSDGGIYSTNGDITVSEGAVIGDISSNWYTVQTDSGNIDIAGQVGNISGDIAITSEYSHDITITGKVGNITGTTYGVFAYKNFTVSESAEIGDVSGNSGGIMAIADVAISGKIGAINGTHGIYAMGNVLISGEVGDIEGQCAVRSINGNIEIGGTVGDITGNGGSRNLGNSYGIRADNGKINLSSTVGKISASSDGEEVTVMALIAKTGIELADGVMIKTPENSRIGMYNDSYYTVFDTMGTDDAEDDAVAQTVKLGNIYKITFETNGGSAITSQQIAQGDTCTEPTAPTRDGYIFGGWYTDEACTNEYDFSAAVTKSFTLYAKWTERSANVGGGGSSFKTYTVKFETNGGRTVTSKTVAASSKLPKPTAPTKEGYTFAGWYTDSWLTQEYDFSEAVTKGFVLYAKWTGGANDGTDGDGSVAHNCPSLEFNDLNVNMWYHLDTDYVIGNGLMNGTGAKTFAPNANLTRAMLVTVIYRAENEPEVSSSSTFADIKVGSWYENAVAWAQANGIVNGYSAIEFKPDQNITREQIAAIMHRYAQYKGYDVSVGERTDISSYADYSSVSGYAVDAMKWAVGSGLINGRSATTLNPRDNATRAEIAAILHRFIENN